MQILASKNAYWKARKGLKMIGDVDVCHFTVTRSLVKMEYWFR